MTRRLYIVRHGNTFEADETPRRLGRRSDPPLTAAGRNQVAALAAMFVERGVDFNQALSSPLRRTRDTAAVILGGHATAIETADWLTEIDHGPDEDLPDDRVIARIGRATLDNWDRQAVPPPGWHVDAPGRIAAWRGFYAEQARLAAGNVLLVTSNGAARFALLADPVLVFSSLPSLKLRTAAWGLIELDGEDRHLAAWDQRP